MNVVSCASPKVLPQCGWGPALLLALCITACSPRFDWREVAPPDSGCMIALPGKAQTTRRDIELAGVSVPMAMTSTGVGATLFAVGAARLPASLTTDAAATQRTLDYLTDALVRNVGGTRQPLPAPSYSAHSLLGHALRASAALQTAAALPESYKGGNSTRAPQLYARLLLVDDRLYQLVAIGAPAELPPEAIETFFTSFRLTE